MAKIVWPTGLRFAGALGVTGGPQSNLDSFSPETGPAITRRKSTYVVKTYPIELSLITTQERAIFNDFFGRVLRDGSLPFYWVDPMQGIAQYIAQPYLIGGVQPLLIFDAVKSLYAIDTDLTTQFYQKMKFVPISQDQAFSEMRVTPTIYTIQAKVILL